MHVADSVIDVFNELCASIEDFQKRCLPHATYTAPIIDYSNPDDYSQPSITGLGRFFARVEAERESVKAILASEGPKEFSSNIPYTTAVWDQVVRAKWPITQIAQHVKCGQEGAISIDVISEGGDVWTKVNTIKESALMREFREQDSYINSDYDSDSADDELPAVFTNSLIVQAEGLARCAKAFIRPIGLSPPRPRFVLNRLEEHSNGYDDDRIPATFEAIREMGVDLVLGPIPPLGYRSVPKRIPLRPSKKILLDLSVIVGLCCDSSHYPLPANKWEIQARFRALRHSAGGSSELGEHTNVSKDLCHQLTLECQHPFIEEMRDRLTDAGYSSSDLEWYATQEVKDRLPSIIDLIGGPLEKERAKALFCEGDGQSFWKGSRYEQIAGVLQDIRVSILDEQLERTKISNNPSFVRGLVLVCDRMLSVHDNPTKPATQGPLPKKKRKPKLEFNAVTNRVPSAHTLRTLSIGARNGMTVFTNNRGAVLKIRKEMGILDGLPFPTGDHAVIWVFNPNSLAEWRRVEVQQANAALRTELVESN